MTATATMTRPAKKAGASSDRKSEILSAIEHFEEARKVFAETPGDPPPGVAFWRSLANVCHSFAAGPLPPELVPAVSNVEAIALLLVPFAESPSNDWEQLAPTDAIFSAYEGLQKAIEIETRPPQKLESVKELKDQGVGIPQIAKMLGMREADVGSEIETPGLICVEGWQPPILARQAANKAEAAKHLSNGVVLSCTTAKLTALGFGPTAN
ncbi:MAG TPA: hypothetical protein VGJ15_06265 [Pirellulales bacterium]|jgi:hypothetical protein